MFVKMQALGSVERDPELRITEEGLTHIGFPLAVSTKRCVQDVTVRLSCYAWGDQAENIKRSVTKGAMLFVQGHFSSYPYTGEDGKPEVNLEVNVEEFSFANESGV